MTKKLRKITDAVEQSVDFLSAMNMLVIKTRQVLETDASSLYLIDAHSDELVLFATNGFYPQSVCGKRYNKAEGLIGKIATSEQAINAFEPSLRSDFLPIGTDPKTISQAFLGVPIIHNRRLLAILTVESLDKRPFQDEHTALLSTIATQVSNYIDKSETAEIVAKHTGKPTRDDTVLLGLPSGKGVGIGTAVAVYPMSDLEAVIEQPYDDLTETIGQIHRAVADTKAILQNISDHLHDKLPEAERELFNAYIRLLEEDGLEADIVAEIKLGQWAQGAVKKAILQRVRQLEAIDDSYLQERAADIKDLGQRILARVQSASIDEIAYPEQTILIADTLSATDIAKVPVERLAGIACAQGSPNSHVAILARAMGVPAITGVANLPVTQLNHQQVIIDGYYGHLYVAPTTELKHEFQLLAEQERELDKSLTELRHLSAETPDGHRISIQVNLGLQADTSKAFEVGAEGVGLFRTEVTFFNKDHFPSEEEQRIIYHQVLRAFKPKPVTIRTLDIGGDKILPYFPINETNPFLGWRGIRVSLDQPDLFTTQVSAIIKANIGNDNCHLLLPMISSVDQILEAKHLISQTYNRLLEQHPDAKMPKLGVMIEVPAAVYQIRTICKYVDFISIGTNDLAQYILAVDRTNPKVASIYDAYHPAVLHAIHHVIRAARLAKLEVSICGELAGDPIITLLLVAMGVTSLSVSPANFPRVKWVVRRFPFVQMRSILKHVMRFESATEIRKYLENTLEQSGLGGLTRAGR